MAESVPMTAHRAWQGRLVSASALGRCTEELRIGLNKQCRQAQLLVCARRLVRRGAGGTGPRQPEAPEEQLGYTTITSPIMESSVARCGSRRCVSSILVLDRLPRYHDRGAPASLVKGKVDESDIGKVYMGQPARIKVESFKARPSTAGDRRFADGRREGQRHDLRSPGFHQQPRGELKAAMTANAENHLEEQRTYCRFRGSILYDKDKRRG